MAGERTCNETGDRSGGARRWSGSLLAVAVLSMAVCATGGAVRADGPDEAHSLADRFAGAGKAADAKPTDAVAPKPAADKDAAALEAYENEMLARAREEARARTDAELAREQQAAAEQRRRLDAEESSRKLSERLRAAREARRAKEALEKAQAEVAERERRAAEADALRLKAEAELKARAEGEAAARAKAAADAAEEARARAVARLVERRQHLADRIANDAPLAATPAALGGPSVPAGEAAAAEPIDGRTVTVLLVMNAGNKGIRRWNKNADPMLCVDDKCYISRGMTSAAKSLARTRAFGPGVALGDRAGACRNTLVCAFRGVSLASDKGWMQPIDLRILRHDRRTAQLVSADRTCRAERGALSCSVVVEGGDYRAWIVPEPTAEKAGPAAIEAALRAELVVERGGAQ